MGENTKILSAEFDYVQPATTTEALTFLHGHDHVKILAGGTDLLVKLKTGAGFKADYLMNIKEIAELNHVTQTEEEIRIGAVTPLSVIEKNDAVKEKLPALWEAIRGMAAPAIRNMGTLGGNLCNSSPAGDTIPPLTVYNARLILVSPGAMRLVPVSDFFLGPGRNILLKEEMLSEIVVPLPASGTGAAFLKKTRVKADIAKINVAVFVEREGNTCRNCKIALGSVGPTVIRVSGAEERLEGKMMREELVQEAARIVSKEIRPIDDNRSTAEYRKEISRVLVEDAVKLAWRRSGGEISDDPA